MNEAVKIIICICLCLTIGFIFHSCGVSKEDMQEWYLFLNGVVNVGGRLAQVIT